jgi:hypothetical protein
MATVPAVIPIRSDTHADARSFQVDLRHRWRGRYECPRCNDANRKLSHTYPPWLRQKENAELCISLRKVTRHPPGTFFQFHRLSANEVERSEDEMGKGILLWLIGIPLPIILVIWLLGGLH